MTSNDNFYVFLFASTASATSALYLCLFVTVAIFPKSKLTQLTEGIKRNTVKCIVYNQQLISSVVSHTVLVTIVTVVVTLCC